MQDLQTQFSRMAKQGNSEKCKIMSKTCLLIAALVVISGCPRQSLDKNMTFEAIKSVDAVQVRQYLAGGAAINLKKLLRRSSLWAYCRHSATSCGNYLQQRNNRLSVSQRHRCYRQRWLWSNTFGCDIYRWGGPEDSNFHPSDLKTGYLFNWAKGATVNTEKEEPVIKELKSGTVTQDHNTFGTEFEMEQDKT